MQRGRLFAPCAALLACLALPAAAQTPIPVIWSIAPLPATAASGKTVDATITAVIDEGWKVYSLTQAPGGPVALVIGVAKGGPFRSAGPVAGPLHHVSFDPNFGFDTEYYESKAVFKVPVKHAGTPSAPDALRIALTYQTCNQRLCLPPTDVELTTLVGTTGTTGTTGTRNKLSPPASSVSGTKKADSVSSLPRT